MTNRPESLKSTGLRETGCAYIETGAIARVTANGGGLYGLPDRPQAPEIEETDRPGSRLTAPNATDQSVRLAQFIRVSGLRGVAVLDKFSVAEHRHLSANGRPTRSRAIDPRGFCPADIVSHYPEDHEPRDEGIRFARRYRESMKGAKFARSLELERTARYWHAMRESTPYWPWDAKNGRLEAGVSYKGDRLFKDGSTMRERYALHLKALEAARERGDDVPEDQARARLDRETELAELEAQQRADAKADRKHSKRVRMYA